MWFKNFIYERKLYFPVLLVLPFFGVLLIKSHLFAAIEYNLVFTNLTKGNLGENVNVRIEGENFNTNLISEYPLPSKARILQATWNAATNKYSLEESLITANFEPLNRFVVAQCAIGQILIDKKREKDIILGTLDFPETAQCLFPYAEALEKNGHWEHAMEVYNIIITYEPDHVSARRALAELLYFNGDKRSAVEHYEVISKLEPTSRDYYRLLQAYRLSGQTDEMVKTAREAVTLFPNDPWLKYEMAEIILLENGEEEAIDFLKEQIKEKPDSARLWYVLCRVYDEIGQTENSIEACQQSIAVDENFMWSYYWLSKMLLLQERTQEALDYTTILMSEESISGTRLEFLSYLNLGDIYIKLENTKEAINAFCNALELNQWPDKTEYLYYQLSTINGSCSSETK